MGWLVIALLAVVDGIFRENVSLPVLGYFWAHVISGLIMCAVVLFVAWATLRRGRPAQEWMLWLAGAIWVSLIVLLEWGIVVLEGGTFMDLLATYHPAQVLEGQFISLGLLLTFCAPWLAARVLSR